MSCVTNILANLLLRPPRYDYDEHKNLPNHHFTHSGITGQRIDFNVESRGFQIICSLFHKKGANLSNHPCVIFLHGNTGCRTSAMQILEAVLQCNMSLLAFDFPGCGKSGGNEISLGTKQSEDIRVIVNHLSQQMKIQQQVLWGRSMGAVAALYYEAKYSDSLALILDSPFGDFLKMVDQILDKKIWLTKYLAKIMLSIAKQKIEQRMQLQLQNFKPRDTMQRINSPIVFITSEQDELVNKSHVEDLYGRCGSQYKKLLVLSGNHNQKRDLQKQKQILNWLVQKAIISARSHIRH